MLSERQTANIYKQLIITFTNYLLTTLCFISKREKRPLGKEKKVDVNYISNRNTFFPPLNFIRCFLTTILIPNKTLLFIIIGKSFKLKK